MLLRAQGRALSGAAVAALIGLAAFTPLGDGLGRLSFDVASVFSTPGGFPEILLVEMDGRSHEALGYYRTNVWSYQLHAGLVDHLCADEAALVVFDVFFGLPRTGDPAAEALGRSIRQCGEGRVVLASDLVDVSPGLKAELLPGGPLREAAVCGLFRVDDQPDRIVRRLVGGVQTDARVAETLSWVAAGRCGVKPGQPLDERWIRYYGPGGTLPRVSYMDATNQPAGFFRDKVVFVGAGPHLGFSGDGPDEFDTPWGRYGDSRISGMEVHATQFLNLVRGDWLRRLALPAELGLIGLIGILVGAGLGMLRPWPALAAAVGAAVVLVAAALWLFWEHQRWFAWCTPVMVQIPFALVWLLATYAFQLEKEKAFLEAPMAGGWGDPGPVEPLSISETGSSPPGSRTVIPDHELLRCIGRGGYGEVWLARDALGSFHAVKIIRRDSFPSQIPYQREFRGLQKFTPVSREHPGLVHILHVGINESGGYFFYVMEAGDDARHGPEIEPGSYTPRTLAVEILSGIRPGVAECLELFRLLAESLAFLHEKGLIHRDIKPANIIFVKGCPKLADVGLVTDAVSPTGLGVSYVGTEGYLPPEGPGKKAGDVYAMGMVMAEVRGSVEPEGLTESERRLWAGLSDVIRRAIASEPARRFPDGSALRDALGALGKE